MAYIDTKYLFECKTCRRYKNGKCDSWCECGEQYSPNMSKIPNADVAEVKHGHWIGHDEAIKKGNFDLAYCCSICGRCDWDCTESELFNYCPNCGAKMDNKKGG